MQKRALLVDLLSKFLVWNGWKGDSISTSYHTTSTKFSMVTLNSLWHKCVYPHFGQFSARTIVKSWPCGQLLSSFSVSVPFFRSNRSRKSNSLKWIPYSFSDKTTSQLYPLFFWGQINNSAMLAGQRFFRIFHFFDSFRLIITEVYYCFFVASGNLLSVKSSRSVSWSVGGRR